MILRAILYVGCIYILFPTFSIAQETQEAYQAIRAGGSQHIIAIEPRERDAFEQHSHRSYRPTLRGSIADPTLSSDQYLHQIQEQFEELGIVDMNEQLLPYGYKKDDLGFQKITYKQLHKGVPVIGAGISIHLHEDNSFKRLTGRFARELAVETTPRVSQYSAELRGKMILWNEPIFAKHRKLIRFYASRMCSKNLSRRYLVHRTSCYRRYFRLMRMMIRIFLKASAKLEIHSKQFLSGSEDASDARLVWKVQYGHRAALTQDEILIDAHTGKLIAKDNGIRGLNRQIFDCTLALQGDCALDFFFQLSDRGISFSHIFGRSEGQSSRGSNPVSSTPFFGSTDVDDFYNAFSPLQQFFIEELTVFGTQESDDFLWESQKLKTHFDNTNLGEDICRDRPTFSGPDYIGACNTAQAHHHDTFAHEYAHFITNNIPIAESGSGFITLALNNQGEAGSIAEAFSDFIGEAYERKRTGSNDWKVNTAQTHPFARDMADPTQSYDNTGSGIAGIAYPDRVTSDDRYCGAEDNGGVHINAGIVNKATYLMVEGGDFNGCRINGIGIEKVKRIWYRAVKEYFDISALTFNQAAEHLRQSCEDFRDFDNHFGITDEDCEQVQNALYATEMNFGDSCSTTVSDWIPTCTVPSGDLLAGDYDRSNVVNAQDFQLWQSEFGRASGTAGDGADGNGDTIVSAADYTIWRDSVPTTPTENVQGDYNNDGRVTSSDHQTWQSQFGSTPNQPGSGADGNGDNIVSAADYTIWRDNAPR